MTTFAMNTSGPRRTLCFQRPTLFTLTVVREANDPSTINENPMLSPVVQAAKEARATFPAESCQRAADYDYRRNKPSLGNNSSRTPTAPVAVSENL
jgi:hypothetical protein